MYIYLQTSINLYGERGKGGTIVKISFVSVLIIVLLLFATIRCMFLAHETGRIDS